MTSTQHEVIVYLNVNVNPCVRTHQGSYCLQHHSLTFMCKHPSQLYAQYGWYLGTVWIGDNHLDSIPITHMSTYLKQLETTMNTCVQGSMNTLGNQLYQKIITICHELQTCFTEKTFTIQNHSIVVPELSASFNGCITSSKQ